MRCLLNDTLCLLLMVGVQLTSGFVFSHKRGQPMLDMLDSMQLLMTGEAEYDRSLYADLRTCMRSFDRRLPKSQDGAWQGFIDYWNAGGAPGDAWGETATGFGECNVTETSIDKMTIYEPCNYASNMAYYHFLLELCHRKYHGKPFSLPKEYVNALGKAISALAIGSSFMHGSNTILGSQQDTDSISVVAYIMH